MEDKKEKTKEVKQKEEKLPEKNYTVKELPQVAINKMLSEDGKEIQNLGTTEERIQQNHDMLVEALGILRKLA